MAAAGEGDRGARVEEGAVGGGVLRTWRGAHVRHISYRRCGAAGCAAVQVEEGGGQMGFLWARSKEAREETSPPIVFLEFCIFQKKRERERFIYLFA